MGEIYVNEMDIESIVNSYKRINKDFVVYSFIDDKNKKTCKFYLNRKECRVDFWIKKNTVRVLPVGKNQDEAIKLIEYIESQAQKADVPASQIVFKCNFDMISGIINNIEEEFCGLIKCNQNGNIYRFKGYNGDTVTLTLYPTKNKAMIQARPLYTFGIIANYLSELTDITFDEFVEINNAFANVNMPSQRIREDMKEILKNSYNYLDDAILKSISGSLILLKRKEYSEDYTGYITGEFKALEGYLKKVLVKKYGYKIKKKQSFSMFYRENGNKSEIDLNTNINDDEKSELNRLYRIYSDKRNVYLHSTVEPSQMRIIESIKEAQELSDEILNSIEKSYNIIFR